LASCYQFSQAEAKTEDHFFKGFPSYWNLLVIYLFLLGTSAWINFISILAAFILSFLPLYFIYPSRTPFLRRVTIFLSFPWIILLVAALFLSEPKSGGDKPFILGMISLYYIIYYLALSIILTIRRSVSPGESNQGRAV
jgi:phosphatidylcholine synthase